MPKDWCDDPALCQQDGIPEGADGYYGNDAEFASAIDQLGYLYMLDIHSTSLFILNVLNFIYEQDENRNILEAGRDRDQFSIKI